MDLQTKLDKLIAAQPVAELILKHNYLPSGNSHIIKSLNELHKEVYGKGVMLHCSSCITDMVKRLYNYTKPELIKQLTPKEDGKRKTKKVK